MLKSRHLSESGSQPQYQQDDGPLAIMCRWSQWRPVVLRTGVDVAATPATPHQMSLSIYKYGEVDAEAGSITWYTASRCPHSLNVPRQHGCCEPATTRT